MSTPSFQLIGIDHAPFQALFGLTDEQLVARSARRCRADENPGYPCRVSLEDAQVGDELLLVTHVHQPADSPYRASGPIFVRRGVRQRYLPAGELPSYITSRLMSVRAYDANHAMVAASVCEGTAAGHELSDYFRRADVDYIHLHNARRGCFSCKAIRVQ